jgi:hypothetical protein
MIDYKISKVTLMKVFPIAAYGVNDRIEYEIYLQEDQTPEGALDFAAASIEDWARKNIPVQTNDRSFPVQIRTIPEDPSYDEKERLEYAAIRKTIDEAPTKKIALDLLAKSNFKYNIQLKEIANGKK